MNIYMFLQKRKLSIQLFIFLILLPFLLTASFAITSYLWNQSVAGWTLLLLVLCIVLVYTVIVYLFIKKFTSRIILTKDAIQTLTTGKLSHTIAVEGSDEIAELGTAINKLTDGLKRTTEFTQQIGSGNLQVSYALLSNEDVLGHSLLQMKENLIRVNTEEQKHNWITNGLAKFVEVLRSNQNIKDLSNEIIKNLVQLLNANQGSVFIVSQEQDSGTFLEMQACYAYQRTKTLTQKIAIGQGLVGQTFLEKETVYLKDVPDDFVRITSGLGDATPRNILITPLKINEEVVGVVELASFREFEKHEIAFVEKLGESIAHAITSFRINDNTNKLLHESQQQAEHMRAQEEELRQNQEEMQATQEEISRKYNDLFKQLTELNYESKFDQLKSITSTKKRNIEYYFDIIRSQILTFSENKTVIEAVKAFKSSFHAIHEGVSSDQLELMKESLRQYYVEEFIPGLTNNTEQAIAADTYLPQEIKPIVLQYLYIASNPHPTGKKLLLNDASDGSNYSKAHAVHHPVMRSFLEKFGYYDIFLIDPVTGDMLYSVFKEVDFATSLCTGLYHQTNFGMVVKQAIESEDVNFVKLIDFEPYAPSYQAPASFIACPVYENGQKIGILVFQMPINKINQIVTGDNKWKEDGLGKSGETCIVGEDYKLRSISRELIENEAGYLANLEKAGYENNVLDQIKKSSTSILLEEIKIESVRKGLQGMSGIQMEKSSRGIDMLYAYAPLAIPDVHWIIISSMKEEEASMRINSLRNQNA